MNKKHRIVSKNKRMRSKSRNKTNRRVRRKSMQSRKTLNNRRRKIYKRKTYKRKTYKRKTYKRKTKKNYRMVGGAYKYNKDDFRHKKVNNFEGLMGWFEENKETLDGIYTFLKYGDSYSVMLYIESDDNKIYVISPNVNQPDSTITFPNQENAIKVINVGDNLTDQTLGSFGLSGLGENDNITIYYVNKFDSNLQRD